MGSFNRGGRGGGGRFFGRDGFGRKDFDRGGDRGSRGGFGGDRGSREMFKTTCSNCGKECEVPFRPTNSKPVYCNDCFPKFGGRGGDDRRGGERPRFGGQRPQGATPDMYKGQFENINIKLDKILRLLDPKAPEVKSEFVTEKPKKDSVVDKNIEPKPQVEVKETVVMEAADTTAEPTPKKAKKESKAKASKTAE